MDGLTDGHRPLTLLCPLILFEAGDKKCKYDEQPYCVLGLFAYLSLYNSLIESTKIYTLTDDKSSVIIVDITIL